MKKICLMAIMLCQLLYGFSQETRLLSVDKPQAIADLKSAEGAALVNAVWQVQNARIENVSFKEPGPGTNGDPLLLYSTGKTQLVSKDLGGPNGLAFSPDEKYFYVTNWDIRNIHHTKTLWVTKYSRTAH